MKRNKVNVLIQIAYGVYGTNENLYDHHDIIMIT